ncbi:MAG: glycoside hydrolase family 66 protein [Opitutae bacterium]|nr:glycoside hydrolase family 66 protein [Opitutae bacterium]
MHRITVRRLLTLLALGLPLGLPTPVPAAKLPLPADQAHAVEAYPDKSRYAPGEKVTLHVRLHNAAPVEISGLRLEVSFWRLGRQVHVATSAPFALAKAEEAERLVAWTAPAEDFTGYFVDVQLVDSASRAVSKTETAVDVSSDWTRFPRYGYIAHYSRSEGADPAAWIAELNKYHLNGLEFYDYQYRHEQPLAGDPGHPAARWRDIAGREIDAVILRAFLDRAHERNMVCMAYNASYSAYEDAFRNGSGVKLQWATWEGPTGPRTVETMKALAITGGGYDWQTSRLCYMNQNDPEWQNYLFGKMGELFRVYPFDGWHIDTFGTQGAFAYDGSPVDFVAGFPDFVNRARDFLKKRIVFQTVNTTGQNLTARAAVDFVYSELWENHETFASIMAAAEEVHTANPRAALVFPAYMHRGYSGPDKAGREFNKPSVLLTNAAILAVGASHIELGDGSRLLSSEYFPDNEKFTPSPALRTALRHYYDFLTAYENFLSYEVVPAPATAVLLDHPSNPYGVPNAVWAFTRQKGDTTMVHLINLLGSDNAHWRDVKADRPDAPLLKDVRVRLRLAGKISSVGWASPDCDGGRYRSLPFAAGHDADGEYVDVIIPSLKYWDVLFLERSATGAESLTGSGS